VSDTAISNQYRVNDEAIEASVADYVALLKPRVMSLVVFTGLVGLMAAPGGIHPLLGAIAVLCIAVGAGASGALNMWYDADIDAKMARTAKRPIPMGRISRENALSFGIVLSVGSVTLMGLVANWLAAGLLAFTISFYAVIYTMVLKRRTPQNIVIGGAAGALPPVVGWAAVTGGLAIEPLVMFAIIFMWTPPHFWALGLFREGDYAAAGVPMLPVTHGPRVTRIHILVYSLILAPLGLAPWAMGFAGSLYGVASAVLGALFLYYAVRLFVQPGDRAAKGLFGFSILYLFGIFAALLADVLLRGWL
jgi:protoheme IX farnesyltransferase